MQVFNLKNTIYYTYIFVDYLTVLIIQVIISCKFISQENSITFNSFVQAMIDMNYVAIVRKVYQRNSVPKMGVLFPKMDECTWVK